VPQAPDDDRRSWRFPLQPLTAELVIGELGIVVNAKNHNPSVLNPDFLKRNGIVPEDWEIHGDVISLPPFSQVQFGGITISADIARLTVTEDLLGKPLSDAQSPGIVRRYVETLPHVAYRAVGINPEGHVEYESSDEVERFVTSHLLAQGPWQRYEDRDAHAALTLRYPDDTGHFQLSIESARHEPPGADSPVPVLLFAANFHRHLNVLSESRPGIEAISAILDGWTADVETYVEFVDAILA
jgi:hypothetical protein